MATDRGGRRSAAAPSPTRRGWRGPEARTWALAAVVAGAALVVHHVGVAGWPGEAAPVRLPWWSLAMGFLCTEVFVVHLHLRRDSHAFSLSELPLVLHARQAPHKAAFNAATSCSSRAWPWPCSTPCWATAT